MTTANVCPNDNVFTACETRLYVIVPTPVVAVSGFELNAVVLSNVEKGETEIDAPALSNTGGFRVAELLLM